MKDVKRRWKNMRDCIRRKLHLQKQPKSAFANEVMLSLVPAFNNGTMTRSVGQRWKCEESQKCGVSATVCLVFYCNDFITTRRV